MAQVMSPGGAVAKRALSPHGTQTLERDDSAARGNSDDSARGSERTRSSKWRSALSLANLEAIERTGTDSDPFAIDRAFDDDPANSRHGFRWKCAVIVESYPFNAFIGICIIANCVTIGLEQHRRLEQQQPSVELSAVEDVFLVIYSLELLMRYLGVGWRCLHNQWVWFDTVLVVLSIFLRLASGHSDSIKETSSLMMMRTVRLVRLVRALKLVVKFKVFWTLLRGLLGSAPTMIYTLMVLAMLVSVVAAVGLDLVTLRYREHDYWNRPEIEEVVETYFGTLMKTMLTIIQFLCLDSVAQIYRPLILHDPILWLYFVPIILLFPIVLLNLVTAITVNGAMEQAANDKIAKREQEAHRKRKLIEKAKLLFRELDTDESNAISREEMTEIGDQGKDLLNEICGNIDPLTMFDLLDVDGSGELEIDEFCEGVYEVINSGASLETLRMQKEVQLLYAGHSEVSQVMNNILEHVDPETLSRMKQDLAMKRAKTNALRHLRSQTTMTTMPQSMKSMPTMPPEVGRQDTPADDKPFSDESGRPFSDESGRRPSGHSAGFTPDRLSAQALSEENAALRERLRLTEAKLAKLSAEVGSSRGAQEVGAVELGAHGAGHGVGPTAAGQLDNQAASEAASSLSGTPTSAAVAI